MAIIHSFLIIILVLTSSFYLQYVCIYMYILYTYIHPPQVSILPQGEESPIVVKRDMTPLQLLHQLQAHTNTTANINTNSETSSTNNMIYSPKALNLPFSPNVTHVETARWCLCGIKNISRPSKDPIAAQALLDCGILDVVLRVLSIGSASLRQASNDFHRFSSNDFKGININHE